MNCFIYITAILIPIASIYSQFVGNHKSLTIGRIIISLMSILGAALFSSLNYIAVTECERSETWIPFFTLPTALIVLLLQREFSGAKILRICGCVLGSFLLICLVVVNVFYLHSTTDSYQNRMFHEAETQEIKNNYFTQDDIVEYFGHTMPLYDVIDYNMTLYGPDYNLDIVLLVRDTIPENYFAQSAKLLQDRSDSITATTNEFYRLVNGHYELTCKLSKDSTIIHIATM